MSSVNKIATLTFLVISLFLPNLCQAKAVYHKFSNVYLVENTYYLDALFNFTLTEEVLSALKHGIPLEIHTLIELRLKRTWLWDNTISETELSYRLEHQPLTEDYLTINLKTGQRRLYDNLDAALNFIGTISKLTLFDKTILQQDKFYIGRIRTFLDLKALPSPMRPQVYFSSKWDIDSKWHGWEIKQ